MPYRAMLMTLFTVLLALIAVAMWAHSISPKLAEAVAASQAAGPPPIKPAVNPGDDSPKPPFEALRSVVGGTMFFSFLLICLLLFIGLLGTLREWFRVSMRRRERTKTTYVDAWKIAGDRMNPDDPSGSTKGTANN